MVNVLRKQTRHVRHSFHLSSAKISRGDEKQIFAFLPPPRSPPFRVACDHFDVSFSLAEHFFSWWDGGGGTGFISTKCHAFFFFFFGGEFSRYMLLDTLC